ncbi:MAG: organoarsenical effux MFS transporter ArsJ [Marinobacterium sp.]
MNGAVRQYLIITGNYWAFTLTDGALRMLVVLYFHQLGYSPLQIAFLFLFYELFGVVTNLVGGWLGARIGLNRTMNIGLALQIAALSMLALPSAYLTIPWVMAAQALSGIAKDLNKMSAKSAIKQLVPENADSALFKWVALLTGSKNTLKGVGFFLGGALLVWLGFQGAVTAMAAALLIVWVSSLLLLKKELGKASYKPKFREIFSKSDAVNRLSAARFFLFGARDIWFVIALPVFLSETLSWGEEWTGAFMALWIIGYGIIQASSPKLLNNKHHSPGRNRAVTLASLLTIVPATIATLLYLDAEPTWVIMIGLALFALIFALNSAVHSYLIVSYAKADGVSLDVGFYYMANAMGRLIGTLLSGALFQWAGLGVAGLVSCLVGSAAMILMTAILSRKLPS